MSSNAFGVPTVQGTIHAYMFESSNTVGKTVAQRHRGLFS